MEKNIEITSIWNDESSLNQDVYIHSSSTFEISGQNAQIVDIQYNTSKYPRTTILVNKDKRDTSNIHIL